jgi:molecular chaperone DnaK
VHVRIVESGAGVDKPPTEIGECYLTHLPPGLPSGSHVEVTISYDTQARVHVTAREPNTNVATEVEFIRQENLSGQLEHSVSAGRPAGPTTTEPTTTEPTTTEPTTSQPTTTEPTTSQPAAVAVPPADHGDSLATQSSLKDASVTPASESAEELVLRCRACNSPLNANGECESEECITDSQALRKWVASSDEARMSSAIRAEDEFWNLVDED